MNKKLLGIAAVALLGVSAAFAATTSTVYFTASGTLTKVLDSQVKDNEGDGTGKTDEGKLAVGVSYVDTSTSKKVYKGEDASSSSDYTIKVSYSKSTRVATGITDGVSTTQPSYVYKDISLSGLKFSEKGDYVYIPFSIYNTYENGKVTWDPFIKVYSASIDSNSYDIYGMSVTDSSLSGVKNTGSTDVTNTYFKVVVTTSYEQDATFYKALNAFPKDNTNVNSVESTSGRTTLSNGILENCGLYIELLKDITADDLTTLGLKEGAFSGLTISLPSFSLAN